MIILTSTLAIASLSFFVRQMWNAAVESEK